MTEEQAVAMLVQLEGIHAAGLVCAKALCWILGFLLMKVVVEGSSRGSGFFGKPRL